MGKNIKIKESKEYIHPKSGKITTNKEHLRKRSSIRSIHQKRPWEDRFVDELTTEEIVSDPKTWLSDPNKYDFQRVDEGLPDNISIVEEVTEGKECRRGIISLTAEKSFVNTVSFPKQSHAILEYIDMGNKRHINLVTVKRGKKGQGLSNILLRNITINADKNNKTLILVACPLDKGKRPTDTQINALSDYYSEFGFERVGKIFRDKGGSGGRNMIRKPRRH